MYGLCVLLLRLFAKLFFIVALSAVGTKMNYLNEKELFESPPVHLKKKNSRTGDWKQNFLFSLFLLQFSKQGFTYVRLSKEPTALRQFSKPF